MCVEYIVLSCVWVECPVLSCMVGDLVIHAECVMHSRVWVEKCSVVLRGEGDTVKKCTGVCLIGILSSLRAGVRMLKSRFI